MSDEIEGRINALSLALEIALKELYTLRFGEAKKTVNVATADIDRLMRTAQKDLDDSPYKTGTIAGLAQISNRLRKLFT